MKASELIVELQEAIEKHGDLIVVAHDASQIGALYDEAYIINSVTLDTRTYCLGTKNFLHLNKTGAFHMPKK